MYKNLLAYVVVTILLVGCGQQKNEESNNKSEEVEITKTISASAIKVRDFVKKDAVIAHRGTTYWAPEETEPAFLWAKYIGADYLEFDVQLTKDGVLIAFHDDVLTRTTNVADVFPERTNAEMNAFTLKELRSLDAGSSFNATFPERARESYVGLKIVTLKDVIMLAEGNRIKKENGEPVKEMIDGNWNGNYVYEKDPNDNGNRPGIYVETKNPKFGPEAPLAKELTEYGWNINSNPKTIKTTDGMVAVANTNARLILQSFSEKSIVQLEALLPNIPKCYLLWRLDMKGDLKEAYRSAIDFAIRNNVHIIGPSIAGEPNNYDELTAPWMVDIMHKAKTLIHPYAFDSNEQLNTYTFDGVFTNRADLALEFYNRESKSSQEILAELGY